MIKTHLDVLSSFLAGLPPGPWSVHSLNEQEAKLALLKFAVVTNGEVPPEAVEKMLRYASVYLSKFVELHRLTKTLVSSVREKDDGFVVDALALSLVHNALVDLERGI